MKSYSKLFRYQAIILIGAVFFLMSCETLVEVDIPKVPDQIVVSGIFPVDSLMSVSVSRSKFVLVSDAKYEVSLKDATISVFEGDLLVDELLFDTQRNSSNFLPTFYSSSMNFKPEQGKTYKIKADHPGYASVTATTTILEKIKIETIQFENRSVQISKTFFGYPMRIEFNDPVGKNNYYRIEATSTIKFSPSPQFESDEETSILLVAPKLTQGQDLLNGIPLFYGLYYSDINSTTANQKAEFFVDANRIEYFLNNPDAERTVVSISISIILKHLTEEHYAYGITSDLQSKVREDPFAEPVRIKSNVTGGMGIFAGYNYDVMTKEIYRK